MDDISFDAFVRDLETVVDAAGLQRFALLGISQGCAVSIAYAVRHPERVSHLVLYGGYARGRRKRGSAQEIEQADALITLMRQGWGQENPAFRHIFTSLFIPGGTAEQMKWFDELQRVTTSPENSVRIREAMNDIDVSDLLPRVTVPTLVLHCRRRRGGAVRGRTQARRRYPRRAIRRARRQQSPRSGKRPGLGPLARRDQGIPEDLTPFASAAPLFPKTLAFRQDFLSRAFALRSQTSGTMAPCSIASISNLSFSLPSSPR